jgi:hypothetical protein
LDHATFWKKVKYVCFGINIILKLVKTQFETQLLAFAVKESSLNIDPCSTNLSQFTDDYA